VNHDRIREFVFRQSGRRMAGVFASDFDAQEIVFGRCTCRGLQEQTFAAANFNSVSGENLRGRKQFTMSILRRIYAKSFCR